LESLHKLPLVPALVLQLAAADLLLPLLVAAVELGRVPPLQAVAAEASSCFRARPWPRVKALFKTAYFYRSPSQMEPHTTAST
jgi:hypothetical protein